MAYADHLVMKLFALLIAICGLMPSFPLVDSEIGRENLAVVTVPNDICTLFPRLPFYVK